MGHHGPSWAILTTDYNVWFLECRCGGNRSLLHPKHKLYEDRTPFIALRCACVMLPPNTLPYGTLLHHRDPRNSNTELLNTHNTELIHSNVNAHNFIQYDFWEWGLSVGPPSLLYYTILYYTILYYAILYYTIQPHHRDNGLAPPPPSMRRQKNLPYVVANSIFL